MANIDSLKRMSAKELSDIILAEADSQERSYAIVDVRDDGMRLFSNPAQPHPSRPSFTPSRPPYQSAPTPVYFTH